MVWVDGAEPEGERERETGMEGQSQIEDDNEGVKNG